MPETTHPCPGCQRPVVRPAPCCGRCWTTLPEDLPGARRWRASLASAGRCSDWTRILAIHAAVRAALRAPQAST